MKRKKIFTILKRASLIILLILFIGLLIPQKFSIPVQGASQKSYNQNSFWFYPWGTSGTHKGVDIFSKEGTNVVAATSGMVISLGEIKKGGNIILVLGPKWRLHYYAHLKEFKTSIFSWVTRGEIIGTVGTTGNAKGKPPHLHYSIYSMLPYFWRADSVTRDGKRCSFLNPIEYLNKAK